MALLDLPNELLQCILDASRPDGFESLAMTCSRLFDLSKPQIISHNRLKKLYTSVDCKYEGDCAPPYALIQRIWTLPLAAQYVKRASCTISPGQMIPLDRQDQNLDWPTIVDRCLPASIYFERANTEAGHLELWRNRMLAGRSGPDVAMLLTLLPNVEWLAINGYNWKCPEIHLRLIDITMGLIAQDAIAGLCHPLSNLRTVFIHPIVMGLKGFPLQTLAPFIALPSLERLTACSKSARHGRKDYNWPYGLHQSNLQTFELFDTVTTALRLQRILQPMRQLRSFRYVHDPQYVESVPFLDTAGFLRSLIDCVGSTLEELTFTGNICSHTAFGSFKAFQKLSRLEIRLSLLSDVNVNDNELPTYYYYESDEMRHGGVPECLPHGSLSCPRLVDILPPTVKDLILWCDSDPLDTDRLFEGFPTYCKQVLPKLQRLNLVERHENRLESILQELRSAGIEVVVDAWDRRRQWYDPLRWWNTWDWRGKQIRQGTTPPEATAWATSSSN